MLVIKVTASGWFAEKRPKRAVNKVFKAAFRSVGLFWHRKFHHKHFTKAGAREYAYSPRGGERMAKGTKRYRRSYTARKQQTFGHTLPLVWSGASRRLAGIRDARATSKGVRVVIHARTLNRKRRGAKKTMREEMTTISAREERRLMAQIDETLTRRFAKIKGKRTQKL